MATLALRESAGSWAVACWNSEKTDVKSSKREIKKWIFYCIVVSFYFYSEATTHPCIFFFQGNPLHIKSLFPSTLSISLPVHDDTSTRTHLLTHVNVNECPSFSHLGGTLQLAINANTSVQINRIVRVLPTSSRYISQHRCSLNHLWHLTANYIACSSVHLSLHC